MPITRDNLTEYLNRLPPDKRAAAWAEAEALLESLGPAKRSRRDPAQRRLFAGDPWKYFRDVLGYWLSSQQEEALNLIEASDRVLIPSANNVGKTFLIAGYALYRFDAVAALADEEMGMEEQGARILLAGPDHDTIFDALYSEMLTHARRAEQRGYAMPGRRSEASVLWKVRPLWDIQAFSPPKSADDAVAHTASGRHHRNQIALIEEGQGVVEPVWKAIEGQCSAAGNKIVSPFNPTEPNGPAFSRSRNGSYVTLHLTSFEHPNVMKRAAIIPGAIGHAVIDGRVRSDCRDRGKYPDVRPDPEFRDFVYALPPPGAEESGPREDDVLGHKLGEIHVYRPNPAFQAQVLGLWPNNLETGLFQPGAYDQAVKRWLAREPPPGPPDRVGVDVAREGADETCACPSWGDSASALLNAYAESQTEEPFDEDGRIIKPIDRLLASRRAYVGEIVIVPRGDGVSVAQNLSLMFPRSPFVVDEGSVGASVLDHMTRVIGVDATGISFAAAPPEPTPGEEWSENMRTAMYVRAARLVNFGLVDVPDDPALREELMAHEVIPKSRSVDVGGSKERKPSQLLIPKDEVKKRLNPQRSPDRADAFVLSLTDLSDDFDPHIF